MYLSFYSFNVCSLSVGYLILIYLLIVLFSTQLLIVLTVRNLNVLCDFESRLVCDLFISLSSSFPFVRDEVMPATSSPPHLIVFSTLVCLLPSSSSLPPLLPSSHLLTQSSHLSLGLPRLLLPCSRNSAALFGSLSSAILCIYIYI